MSTFYSCSDDTPPSYVDGSGFIIEFFDTGSLADPLTVAGSKYAALNHNYEMLVCLQPNIIITKGIKIPFTLSYQVSTIHQALSQALLSYFDWETYHASWSGWSRYPPEGSLWPEWLAFYFQFKSKQANSWYSLPYYFVALSRLVISILVCKSVETFHWGFKYSLPWRTKHIQISANKIWHSCSLELTRPCAQTVSFSYFISLWLIVVSADWCNFIGLVSALCRLGFICSIKSMMEIPRY